MACLGIAAVSALPAAYDVWKVAWLAVDQLHGAPAQGTDFLNLYAGARLFATDPASTYDLSAQQTLQRSLTRWESPLVPFYLPPYAAVLVSWLAWLSYPVAYVVWLLLGMFWLAVAAHWLAPRWGPGFGGLVWLGICILFLPCLLGLAQGQTAAVMLVCTTAFTLGLLERRMSSGRLAFGIVGLALKPQFAPLFVCALVFARRWRALAIAACGIAALAVVGWLRIGAVGRAAYAADSSQKLTETLSAEPSFLLGPTLLHAGHWFLGVNAAAHVVTACLDLAALAIVLMMWRRGPRNDDARLLQLAVLPVAAVIVSPYALVYELTSWLVTFGLLWRYTEHRPPARAAVLWLTAAVWLAGDVGVMLPLAGGADVAAVLGLALVGFIGWLYHAGATVSAGTEPTSTRALAGPDRPARREPGGAATSS